jgi:hypothetical protein
MDSLSSLARPGGGRFVALVLARAAPGAHGRAERAREFYARGLARLDLSDALGQHGEATSRPQHPYAMHLDLFGRRSLFELLSQAQTQRGEERLAEWLLAPAAADEVRARQAAVAELRPRLALREDLFALGRELGDSMPADPLIAWATAPSRLGGWPLRVTAAAVSGVTVAAIWLALAGSTTWVPAVGLVLLVVAAHVALQRRVASVLGAIEPRLRDLDRLAALLARLEAEPYEAPRLRATRAALDHAGTPASRQIAQLHRLVALLDWRRNQLFAPIAGVLLWGLQIACALESWRARSGGDIAGWLTAVGDFEALGDLAGYAFEHPADPFPELADTSPSSARAGSPAAPRLALCSQRPRELDAAHPLVVVSGSNMSGRARSALHRNAAILDLAGAPVRAQSLRLSPLALGACLRVRRPAARRARRASTPSCWRCAAWPSGAGAAPRLVPARRDPERHQLARPPHRRGRALKGLLARGASARDDPRPRAHRDRRRARPARERHFEGPARERRATLRLPPAPGVIERGNALELMRSVGLEI